MEAGQRAQGRQGGGGHAAPFFFLPCPFGELVRFANCPLVNPAFYSLLLPSPVQPIIRAPCPRPVSSTEMPNVSPSCLAGMCGSDQLKLKLPWERMLARTWAGK